MNIKELAEKIGVSSATVSRVINNSGYVSDKTRQEVLAAIEKYQYVPNDIARSLSTKSTRSIGVIIPDIENEFFSAVISGISQMAEVHGYNINFMGTNENVESEHAFLENVGRQRLDGVIIVPVSQEDAITREKLLQIEKKGVPVVMVDRCVTGTNFEGVFVDSFSGAYEGVQALIREGHKRIATITGPVTSKPGRERRKGYVKALEDAGIEIRPEYIVSGDFRIDKAYRCTEQLLQLDVPPTAIFTSNNLTTMGCLKYFTEHNLKIGKQISILGFDDIEVLKIIKYKLSVVARDAKQQGIEAMKLLLDQLEHKNIPKKPRQINIPYQVILRGSEKLNL